MIKIIMITSIKEAGRPIDAPSSASPRIYYAIVYRRAKLCTLSIIMQAEKKSYSVEQGAPVSFKCNCGIF